MIQPVISTMIYMLLARFMLNDIPHILGVTRELPSWYIKSKPPTAPYLYHHAAYPGLKRIAERWAIEAPSDKQTISLTTDPGRFLSPLPFIIAITVDGVIKMPYDDPFQAIAIPALYQTHNEKLADEARSKSYEVFTKEELPPEYRYIMPFVVHKDVFVNENEYVVIAKYLNVPVASVIYVDPRKITRFKAGLPEHAMQDIRPLTELVP